MAKPRKHKRNQPKFIEPTTEGRCPYCHIIVKSLEHHINDKHKGEKLVKRT